MTNEPLGLPVDRCFACLYELPVDHCFAGAKNISDPSHICSRCGDNIFVAAIERLRELGFEVDNLDGTPIEIPEKAVQ